MRLYLDIGNSRVKWANAEELALETVHHAPSNDFSAALIPALQALDAPSAVHVASVLSPARIQPLGDWMQVHWGLVPRFAVTRAAELGVVNGYRTPAQLGVDRWLGLLAARALSQRPQLVVDCGTATTLDVLDGQGRHHGGAILPGLQLFRHCLQHHTDIPETQESPEIDGFATDTATGIAAGAMLATASVIEAMLGRMRQRFGHEVGCLLTGGFSARVAQQLESPLTLAPHLILHGLALQAGQKDRQ